MSKSTLIPSGSIPSGSCRNPLVGTRSRIRSVHLASDDGAWT